MKNKFRSLLSMTLALMMIISAMSFATVMAADKGVIDGLYVDYSGESNVTYATDMAYSGSRSIAIDAKSDSHVWMGDPVGDFKMDPTKAYGLEFYIYVDSWTSGKIWLKPTGNDNNTYPTVYYASLAHGGNGLYLEDTNKDRWGLEKIESGEKAGWYRVWNTTAIISEDGDFSNVSGYGKGYMWYTEGEMKVKLDNINVYEWTGYTTSKNSGTRGDSPVFTQDFEEDTSTEEPTGPVIPDAADLDTENVNLTSHANTKGTYGVTNTFAHSGEHSLYVDSTTGAVGLGSCADDFEMEKQKAYGIQFSIYIAENQSGLIQIKPQNSHNGKTKAVYYATISGTSETGISVPNNGDRWKLTNENGWYTFKSKYPIYVDSPEDSDGQGTPDFLPGELFYFEGKFKAFIDDVEIYEWTANPATNAANENAFGELLAKRDFEPTGDYISDFNVSASGNKVTVSVDIRNCTKDNYTAQLFLAVYDGNTLEFVEMTEKTTIDKSLDTSATPTTLEKTVTIPAGKTMKMYLWDSLEGMTPLKTSKLYE